MVNIAASALPSAHGGSDLAVLESDQVRGGDLDIAAIGLVGLGGDAAFAFHEKVSGVDLDGTRWDVACALGGDARLAIQVQVVGAYEDSALDRLSELAFWEGLPGLDAYRTAVQERHSPCLDLNITHQACRIAVCKAGDASELVRGAGTIDPQLAGLDRHAPGIALGEGAAGDLCPIEQLQQTLHRDRHRARIARGARVSLAGDAGELVRGAETIDAQLASLDLHAPGIALGKGAAGDLSPIEQFHQALHRDRHRTRIARGVRVSLAGDAGELVRGAEIIDPQLAGLNLHAPRHCPGRRCCW